VSKLTQDIAKFVDSAERHLKAQEAVKKAAAQAKAMHELAKLKAPKPKG